MTNIHPTYKLLDKLGEGVHGSELFAIKRAKRVYGPDPVQNRMQFAENMVNLEEEFERLKPLKHPNIAAVSHSWDGVAGRDGNMLPGFAFSMDLMEGGLLSVARAQPAVPESVVNDILFQLLKALVYIHDEHDIAHRDIKPDNITVRQLTPSIFEVKLIDFGLATTGRSDIEADFIGLTPKAPYRWASPEAHRLREEDDSAKAMHVWKGSDCWSTIASIFYLLNEDGCRSVSAKHPIEEWWKQIERASEGTRMCTFASMCDSSYPARYHLEKYRLGIRLHGLTGMLRAKGGSKSRPRSSPFAIAGARDLDDEEDEYDVSIRIDAMFSGLRDELV